MGALSEIWKDIHGYERIYQISNLGRVKAKGNPYFCNGKQLDSDGRILKPQPNSKGYLRIYLTKNGSKKYFFIHRLVAEHFIPNPDELDTVNHKDFHKIIQLKIWNGLPAKEICGIPPTAEDSTILKFGQSG